MIFTGRFGNIVTFGFFFFHRPCSEASKAEGSVPVASEELQVTSHNMWEMSIGTK